MIPGKIYIVEYLNDNIYHKWQEKKYDGENAVNHEYIRKDACWKPSEEQMKALEGAIEIIRLEKEDSLIATVLESLLKQLKAL